jgi:DNA-binding NtrC family response regulator
MHGGVPGRRSLTGAAPVSPGYGMDLTSHPSVSASIRIFWSPDECASGVRPTEAPRILIVEDDYVVGLELEGGLAEAGFIVVGPANSAAEAIRLAGLERPMLALMDIRLAGRRDGIAAASEIFEAFGIRSIFTTAHHDHESRIRAEKAAPLGWLAKPYQLGQLISMISVAIAELKDQS